MIAFILSGYTREINDITSPFSFSRIGTEADAGRKKEP
jgi:hypothetical protein